MNAITDLKAKADRLILQDLFESLVAEGYFTDLNITIRPIEDTAKTDILAPLTGGDIPEDGQIWQWHVADGVDIFAVITPAVLYPYLLAPESQVVLVNENGLQVLGCLTFFDQIGTHLIATQPDCAEGIAVFRDMLSTSIAQMALSLSHRINTDDLLAQAPHDFFQNMEQWASFRDRPYHPVAKAKMGLTTSDYATFMAEFDQDIPIVWIAVESMTLMLGEGLNNNANSAISDYLLTDGEKADLDAELQAKGLAQTHMALPVHPWQLENYIKPHYAAELANGTCHILDFRGYMVKATSSLRSMAPRRDGQHYLKLPMHIFSLAASRYLPAVKMINGNLSETLLRKGLKQDAKLQKRVHVCDENSWWAYFPEGTSLFDERPRHLSAMVRTYPPVLSDETCRLIPMAALGTPLPGSKAHFFDEWLKARDLPATAENVQLLFAELCDTFFDINFRMFRIGMLAEIHGQNTVLVWQNGQAQGLLLRDHDSLRIFVPWLERNGLADPEYRIKKGYANTLYHDRPEDLLFYLQTLGIQVNLRAIAETLAGIYDIPVRTMWATMKKAAMQALDRVGFAPDDRAMIAHHLFDTPNWPYKQLVRPIIARAGGPGSMPWGKGEIQNPFHTPDNT